MNRFCFEIQGICICHYRICIVSREVELNNILRDIIANSKKKITHKFLLEKKVYTQILFSVASIALSKWLFLIIFIILIFL